MKTGEAELYEPNINTLPKFVIEQLEEIERELQEGCTILSLNLASKNNDEKHFEYQFRKIY